jgi:hypothetical protein
LLDEGRLGGGVGATVSAELHGEATLELGVGGSGRRVGAQPIPQRQVAAPLDVAVTNQVQVRHPVGRPVLQHQQQAAVTAFGAAEPAAERLERGDGPFGVGTGRQADGDVQDRLGGQSGYRLVLCPHRGRLVRCERARRAVA